MRKVGGYLVLSGLFGGWFGAMTYSHGFGDALWVTALAAGVLGMLTLAAYLIQEGA